MQRQFKIIKPNQTNVIEKCVSVTSSGSQLSPRVSLLPSIKPPIEQSISYGPHYEPNKVIFASGIVKANTTSTKANSNKPRRNVNKQKPSTIGSNNNLDSKNVTPKVGIIRDTKYWRLDTATSSKNNVTSNTGTSTKSIESVDSSKFSRFKTEFRDDINVHNLVTVVSTSLVDSCEELRLPPTFTVRSNKNDLILKRTMAQTVLQSQTPISNKVGESRKEIDKLKTELESLISTNLKNKNIPSQKVNKSLENIPIFNDVTSVKESRETSPAKKQISPTTFRKKLVESDIDPQKDEPKSKSRTYDPTTAREFIRKQKLKRKEKIKEEELKKKETEELKRQKLQELRQKTLELITENVKKSKKKACAKTGDERINISKSNIQISQDFSPRKPRARSYDRAAINTLKNNNFKETVNKNSNRPWRSRSVSRETNICDKKTAPIIKKSAREPEPAAEKSTKNVEVINKMNVLLNNGSEKKNESKATTKIQPSFRKNQQKNKNTTIEVEADKKATEENNNKEERKEYNVEKSVEIISEKQTESKSAIEQEKKDNVEITNIPEKNCSQKKEELKLNGPKPIENDVQEEIDTIRRKLETSVNQSNVENKKNETPSWLLPPSTLPYPFNFISAVRKKLEIVTKNYQQTKETNPEKHVKDTSIQTTDNLDKRLRNKSVQTSGEKMEIKLKSPIILPEKPETPKTYISHKCRKQLTYSPPKLKSPTHFKDIHKEISVHSVKSKVSETSDSDTTKNIPEISEEESLLKHSKHENIKNVNFNRQTTDKHFFVFDKNKIDKNIENDTKISEKSDLNNIVKNITFDRKSENMSLTKPDFKIDTSKISGSSDQKSKYPVDIESILSQYSKIKSNKSSIHNHSQYSDDFTKSKSKTDQEKHSTNEKESSNSISRIKSSDISKIKTEILASLARKHSTYISSISHHASESVSKNSIENTDNSTDISKKSREILTLDNSVKNSEEISEILTKNSSENKIESLKQISELLIKNLSETSDPTKSKSSSKHSFNKNKSSKSISPNLDSKVINTKTQNSTFNNVESLDKYSSEIQSEINSKTETSESEIEEKHSKSKKSISSISEKPKTESNSTIQEDSNVKSSIAEEINSNTIGTEIKSSDKLEVKSKSSILSLKTIPNLTKPTVNLKIEKEKFFHDQKNNPNQIHLKFQAEVHLLNSFNNSLQQVVAVEKSLLDINDSLRPDQQATVNFRRGCGTPNQMETLNVLEPSVCSQDLNISHLNESAISAASETALSVAPATEKSVLSSASNSIISNKENAGTKNMYMGVSLGMFDQMIREEDNRLEHFKAILKLRDKALFDRTKGELAWLEIQKKQLRENGQLNDVTIIKKKQRGLIIKLEQERHEMQRLKQAHKQAAKERKNALREQKNIIKEQLSSTDQIPTKIRRLSHLERRQSGPVKVYRVESKTEQIKETTMSKNSSGTDETVSVTSSIITQVSEQVSVEKYGPPEVSMALKPFETNYGKESEKVKRALLMKEADLEKRRKEAEELLQWHERLKQEEVQVVELERQAKSIQLDALDKKRVLSGAQLNKIWKGITGSMEKKFDDHKKYQMSKRSLDKFYQNARKIFKEISEERNSSKRGSEDSYTSDFTSQSPNKLNSSIVTRINESDVSISPNKMLSERLKKLSRTSRISLEKSNDKKSIITEIQSEKDNSVFSKSSIVSEIKSEQEFSDKTSRKSSTESEIQELSSKQTETQQKSSKKSLFLVKEKIQTSDSDLPELEIISSIISDAEGEISNIISEIISEKQNSEPSTEISKNSVIEKISPESKSIKTSSGSLVHSVESEIQEDEIIISKNDNNKSLTENISEKLLTEKESSESKSIKSLIESRISSDVSEDQEDEPILSKNDQISSQIENISEKFVTEKETLDNKSIKTSNESQISSIISEIKEDEPILSKNDEISSQVDNISEKFETEKESPEIKLIKISNESQISSMISEIQEDEPFSSNNNQISSQAENIIEKIATEKESLQNKSIKTSNESQISSLISEIQEDEPVLSKNNEINSDLENISEKFVSEKKSSEIKSILSKTEPKMFTKISESVREVESSKTNKSEENTSKIVDEYTFSSDKTKSVIQTGSEVEKHDTNTTVSKIKSVLEEYNSSDKISKTIQSETVRDEKSTESQDVSSKIISLKDSIKSEADIDEKSELSHQTLEKLNEIVISTSDIKSNLINDSNIESSNVISNKSAKISENVSENIVSHVEKSQSTSKLIKSLLEDSKTRDKESDISEKLSENLYSDSFKREKSQNTSEIKSKTLRSDRQSKTIQSNEVSKTEDLKSEISNKISENLDTNIISVSENLLVDSQIKSNTSENVSTSKKQSFNSEIKSMSEKQSEVIKSNDISKIEDEESKLSIKIIENLSSDSKTKSSSGKQTESIQSREISKIEDIGSKISEKSGTNIVSASENLSLDSEIISRSVEPESNEILEIDNIKSEISEKKNMHILSVSEKPSFKTKSKSSSEKESKMIKSYETSNVESKTSDKTSENVDTNIISDDKYQSKSDLQQEPNVIDTLDYTSKSEEQDLITESEKALETKSEIEEKQEIIKSTNSSTKSDNINSDSKEVDHLKSKSVLEDSQNVILKDSKISQILNQTSENSETNSSSSVKSIMLDLDLEKLELKSDLQEAPEVVESEENSTSSISNDLTFEKPEKDLENLENEKQEQVITKSSETDSKSNSKKENTEVDSSVEIQEPEEKLDTSKSIYEEKEIESKGIIEPKSTSSEEKQENLDKKYTETESKINSEPSETTHENIQIEFSEALQLSAPKETDIKSEISTPHDSEFELKSSGDFSSDFEKESEQEKSKTDNSKSEEIVPESHRSEKESSVIESPKSVDDILSPDSKKSVSTETEESIEESKEILVEDAEQNVEENVAAGVSHIDVRKRVSEILADANGSRGDKSPRVQDLYVTAYDVLPQSPEGSPETGSPTHEINSKREKSNFSIETPYRSEAEELLRKQLEIEQEIKQIERQQQQQNIPYLFMREIPNKPPPPYKPPSPQSASVINTVIPTNENQIRKVINQSADILFDAYTSGNLKDASYNNNKSTEDEKKITCEQFVFDLCKEIALDVCTPTEKTPKPSWAIEKNKFQSLISKQPITKTSLHKLMNQKVMQLLNFEPVMRKDNLIIRWSRKKRDHVDEILVLESQAEEAEWTNYDSDELTIKENLTSDFMNALVAETAQVFQDILQKKKSLSWTNYC